MNSLDQTVVVTEVTPGDRSYGSSDIIRAKVLNPDKFSRLIGISMIEFSVSGMEMGKIKVGDKLDMSLRRNFD